MVPEKDGDQFDRRVRNEEVLQSQGGEEYLKKKKGKVIPLQARCGPEGG